MGSYICKLKYKKKHKQINHPLCSLENHGIFSIYYLMYLLSFVYIILISFTLYFLHFILYFVSFLFNSFVCVCVYIYIYIYIYIGVFILCNTNSLKKNIILFYHFT